MHLTSRTEAEIHDTLEVLFEMVNAAVVDGLDPRQALDEAGFSRAANASKASVERFRRRFDDLVPLMRELPDMEAEAAIGRVNEELTELSSAPQIVDHDGLGPHIHWTPPTATFDEQIVADLLMALAYELCENGTIRIGRCDASGCDDLYYDATRNRSRRFCRNPKCASRTHTADFRARQRAG